MWTETILHVDMDAFFVEVERLGDQSLRGRPVAVGGVGPRGVIASASYEARAFGVRSAMPTATARRICPGLEVVSPAHRAYSTMSARVFGVFGAFTPLVEGLSLDEAFLDVAGLSRHYESPRLVGEEIRRKLRSELGLPASVGVASTKFVAKLASEHAKPDGLFHVRSDEQLNFIHGLPVEALWGVGPATLAGLERFGVSTVGELAEIPMTTLASALGPSSARHLLDLANGIDPRQVEPENGSKSVSVEQTFPEDVDDGERLEGLLLEQCERLADRLHGSGLRAQTFTLKLRFSDFRTISRSKTVDVGLTSSRAMFAVVRDLFGSSWGGEPVRLIGLAATSLAGDGDPRQLALGSEDAWDQISGVVHAARERFGPHAVEPARLIEISYGETGREG